MIGNILLLLLGFFALVQGANLLVDGASSIAKSLRIPNLIIGLTIVALGTSAPEAAISITGSIAGNNGVLLGNIIGSNVFNLLMVLGITGMIRPYKNTSKKVLKDYWFLIAISILILILSNDALFGKNVNSLSKIDGMILIALLIVYFIYIIKRSKLDKKVDFDKVTHRLKFMDIFNFIAGLIMLLIGGDWVVDNASLIAQKMSISDGIIGLTIVAMGTSLPEFITGLVAINKEEEEIAIGNVIGSNILNILFILGISSTIKSVMIPSYLYQDLLFMTMISITTYFLIFTKHKFKKIDGILMVTLYVIYTVSLFVR